MRIFPLLTAVGLTLVPVVALEQTDLRAPAGKEWLTIGGDWHNTRYSMLKQVNSQNAKNLKAARVVHSRLRPRSKIPSSLPHKLLGNVVESA